MSTKTYLFHELSSIFPLMEGEEFDDLVEDIRQYGLLEPIVLFEGKILDGRNRYRACKQLKKALKFRKLPTNITPLDFIISENIKRRHLTTAQRTEVGLLLLEEEEKKAKKRIKEMAKLQRQEGSTKFEKSGVGEHYPRPDIEKFGEPGRSAIKVAKKVKVSDKTLKRAKKIKEVAKKDKKIAEDWEKAKKGEIGIGKVYQEIREKEIIEKLPEELKEEVKKEELTVKEAKDVAESFKEPEMRKEAIKTIKKEKKEHERTMDYIKKVGTGEAKLPKKEYMDVNQRIVKQFQGIAKQIVLKMTMNNVKGYNEKTQPILIKIMKKCLEHLQNELNIKGEIINV